MRNITISIDDGEKIELKDNDTTDLQEYASNLASILEETNVVIVKTSESIAILRPTRINGIQIYEISSSVYRYFFPHRIKNNWIELDKEIRENTQLIDVDKDTILIEKTEGDWDIIGEVKKEKVKKIIFNEHS